jgi:hypothetical protein
MCEMTVNSPVEFRNVFPIMFHRLVSQAAHLNLQATLKTAERGIEEEKTEQEKEKRLQARLVCIADQSKRNTAIVPDDLIKICGPSE